MNDNAVMVIDRLFSPGWLMVSQLRAGQQVKDGGALYRRACQWLDDWRGELEQQGVSRASADHLLYTLCALFDETVMNRGEEDQGYRTWLANPLQARYFNTLNAGEELWQRIRSVLQEPAADPAVLTGFARALDLGFVGRYRQQTDERREDVVRNLSQRVTPFTLADPAPVIVRPAGLRRGRHRYWLSWGLGALLLGGLWWGCCSSLRQMVCTLTGSG